jgi:hypothetical protein
MSKDKSSGKDLTETVQAHQQNETTEEHSSAADKGGEGTGKPKAQGTNSSLSSIFSNASFSRSSSAPSFASKIADSRAIAALIPTPEQINKVLGQEAVREVKLGNTFAFLLRLNEGVDGEKIAELIEKKILKSRVKIEVHKNITTYSILIPKAYGKYFGDQCKAQMP